jgi:hypothetical protein
VIFLWLSSTPADFPLAGLVWIFSLFVFSSRPATGVSSVSVLGSARVHGSAPGVLCPDFSLFIGSEASALGFPLAIDFSSGACCAFLSTKALNFPVRPVEQVHLIWIRFWRQKLVLLRVFVSSIRCFDPLVKIHFTARSSDCAAVIRCCNRHAQSLSNFRVEFGLLPEMPTRSGLCLLVLGLILY